MGGAAPSEPSADTAQPVRSLGPERRQERIAEIVLARGTVSAQDLAETFAVSVMTIHRDLDQLQRQGVLRKSRGAATAQPSGTFESNVEYRAKANLEAKQAIAQHACRHVESGMSVLLDDSTTALQMVPHLAALAPLTVATNYLTAMNELAKHRDLNLVGTRRAVRRATQLVPRFHVLRDRTVHALRRGVREHVGGHERPRVPSGGPHRVGEARDGGGREPLLPAARPQQAAPHRPAPARAAACLRGRDRRRRHPRRAARRAGGARRTCRGGGRAAAG